MNINFKEAPKISFLTKNNNFFWYFLKIRIKIFKIGSTRNLGLFSLKIHKLLGHIPYTFNFMKYFTSKKVKITKIEKIEKKSQKNHFFYTFFQNFKKWKFGPSTLFHLKIIGPRLINHESPKYQNFRKWHFWKVCFFKKFCTFK